jgi:Flp pilus assembly protein TadD
MFIVRTTTGGILVLCAVLVLGLSGCSSYQGALLYQSGTLALDRGDSARAIEDLERAAELVPEASEVQNHLGLAYAAAGRDADALKAFQRSVDIDCGNLAAAENLAVAQRHHSGGTGP